MRRGPRDIEYEEEKDYHLFRHVRREEILLVPPPSRFTLVVEALSSDFSCTAITFTGLLHLALRIDIVVDTSTHLRHRHRPSTSSSSSFDIVVGLQALHIIEQLSVFKHFTFLNTP